MSQKGWIKLQRKITDCWIWDDGSPFDRRSAWIDLLLTANHADKKVVLDGQITTVKRGQILTSVRKLSERWKWSRTKVTAFLGILEKDGMVLKESDTKKTLITVENYGFYQDSDSEEKPPKSHRSATEVPPKDTNNNDKNDKNDKDIIFSPKKEPSGKKKKAEEPKHKYGTYGHVLLTDKQYAKLVAEYGEEWTLDTIQYTDNYCEASGRTYKNYLQAMKNWAFAEVKKKGYKRMPAQQQKSQGTVQYGFDGKPIGGGYQ